MISSVRSQALSFGAANFNGLSTREAYDKKIETNNQIASNTKAMKTKTVAPMPVPISLQGNVGNNLDIVA